MNLIITASITILSTISLYSAPLSEGGLVKTAKSLMSSYKLKRFENTNPTSSFDVGDIRISQGSAYFIYQAKKGMTGPDLGDLADMIAKGFKSEYKNISSSGSKGVNTSAPGLLGKHYSSSFNETSADTGEYIRFKVFIQPIEGDILVIHVSFSEANKIN
ncbi:hypothetical protein JIN77_02140 [Verrucomicrobiaceae bacterium R5-34]|nr:hypothetical protein [Verrucomicrobiaceae bacterium R5-34]